MYDFLYDSKSRQDSASSSRCLNRDDWATALSVLFAVKL